MSTTIGSLQHQIRLLDSHTVNQIAAGEVVERPASVVKELIENAIDAGATRIEIELSDAGRTLIRVRDNGCGMDEANARLAILRHATSKIRRAEDLQKAHTLGFRGEALPSVASVSRFRLESAAEDGVRLVLKIEGGEVLPETRNSGPRGTVVEVRDLFFNTPARLKFLKTNTTELSACVDVVSREAVAHPDVAFSLKHDSGSSIVLTTGSGSILESLAEVWGKEPARALVELDFYADGIRVRGFASPPHYTKSNRSMQWIFVNGRPIRSRSLTAAIDQAYRSLTPENRHALTLLLLDVDPSRVDANVSPTKSEVRFQSESIAFDAVRHAIKSALLEHGMVPSADALAQANAAIRESATLLRPGTDFRTGQGASGSFGGVPGHSDSGGSAGRYGGSSRVHPCRDSAAMAKALFGGEALLPPHAEGLLHIEPRIESGADVLAVGKEHTNHLDNQNSREPGTSTSFHLVGGFTEMLDGLRILGQAMSTFILAENHRGILIIDQHVAHERILYEYLRETRGAGAIEQQALLSPETFEVDRRTAALLTDRLDEVRSLGYDIEPFGGTAFLVRAVPAVVRGKSAMEALRDLAEQIVEFEGSGPSAVNLRDELLILCSCKMAIKAGDPLVHAEMEKLIWDLAQTENPYLCPHGRPITIVLEKNDLLRKFKRL